MGYVIHYSGKRADVLVKAYADAVDYLGTRRLTLCQEACARTLRSKLPAKLKVHALYCMLSFSGVRGLPATAIIKRTIKLIKEGAI